MKALVVRQPWATLIALGVKSIETRPGPPNGPMRPDGVRGLPGCTLERGERIAIVAGAAAPPHRDHGPWNVGRLDPLDPRRLWKGSGPIHDLPLGAVVCTVVVADALPIVVGGEEGCIRTIDNDDGGSLWVVEPTRYPSNITEAGVAAWNEYLSTFPPGSTAFTDPGQWEEFCDIEGLASVEQREITDELPLGDFTPGRWGWMLTDPEPCDPIPCKGRQGVFELPEAIS